MDLSHGNRFQIRLRWQRTAPHNGGRVWRGATVNTATTGACRGRGHLRVAVRSAGTRPAADLTLPR